MKLSGNTKSGDDYCIVLVLYVKSCFYYEFVSGAPDGDLL